MRGYKFIHTSNSGTKEQYYDLTKGLGDDYILKGAWQWDTEEEDNTEYGPYDIDEVVVEGDNAAKPTPKPDMSAFGYTASQYQLNDDLKKWGSDRKKDQNNQEKKETDDN